MRKTFVKVAVDVDEDGKKTPRSLVFGDITYIIDKVIDIRNCASFKAGGIGERYTIRIGDSTTHIYYENGRWFVEEK